MAVPNLGTGGDMKKLATLLVAAIATNSLAFVGTASASTPDTVVGTKVAAKVPAAATTAQDNSSVVARNPLCDFWAPATVRMRGTESASSPDGESSSSPESGPSSSAGPRRPTCETKYNACLAACLHKYNMKMLALTVAWWCQSPWCDRDALKRMAETSYQACKDACRRKYEICIMKILIDWI